MEVVTLTDQEDTPSRRRKLRRNYQGWVSKMELFAPWNKDLRPCVYFDLDTYILWDVSDLLTMRPTDLWLIRDFYFPEKSNSGVMVIPEDTDEIWEAFLRDTSYPFKDGDFLNQFPHRILQDNYSGIVSYKADDCYDEPKGRVVCFHGVPKPHECKGWAGEIWNSKKP